MPRRRHWRAKLTPKKVREIRRLHSAGVSQRQLAIRYRVAQPTIGQIIHRDTWRDV